MCGGSHAGWHGATLSNHRVKEVIVIIGAHLTFTCNTRGLLPLYDLFYYHFPHTDLGSIFFFQLAMKAVPYRKDFITALGKGQADEETVLKDMQHCTSLLGANWDVIEDFYQKTGQDSDQKV